MGKVLRVVGPDIRRDRKLGHEDAGADFGNEFFECVSLVAEALPEFAVETMRSAAPMQISCSLVAANASSAGMVSVPVNDDSGGI